MASVRLANLSKEQANAIAILFEDGCLQDFINEKLEEKYGEELPQLSDDYEVRFDENDLRDPSHDIWFR